MEDECQATSWLDSALARSLVGSARAFISERLKFGTPSLRGIRRDTLLNEAFARGGVPTFLSCFFPRFPFVSVALFHLAFAGHFK